MRRRAGHEAGERRGVLAHRRTRPLGVDREQRARDLLDHAVCAGLRAGVDDDRGGAEQSRFDREVGEQAPAAHPGLRLERRDRALAADRRPDALAQLRALARAADGLAAVQIAQRRQRLVVAR